MLPNITKNFIPLLIISVAYSVLVTVLSIVLRIVLCLVFCYEPYEGILKRERHIYLGLSAIYLKEPGGYNVLNLFATLINALEHLHESTVQYITKALREGMTKFVTDEFQRKFFTRANLMLLAHFLALIAALMNFNMLFLMTTPCTGELLVEAIWLIADQAYWLVFSLARKWLTLSPWWTGRVGQVQQGFSSQVQKVGHFITNYVVFLKKCVWSSIDFIVNIIKNLIFYNSLTKIVRGIHSTGFYYATSLFLGLVSFISTMSNKIFYPASLGEKIIVNFNRMVKFFFTSLLDLIWLVCKKIMITCLAFITLAYRAGLAIQSYRQTFLPLVLNDAIDYTFAVIKVIFLLFYSLCMSIVVIFYPILDELAQRNLLAPDAHFPAGNNLRNAAQSTHNEQTVELANSSSIALKQLFEASKNEPGALTLKEVDNKLKKFLVDFSKSENLGPKSYLCCAHVFYQRLFVLNEETPHGPLNMIYQPCGISLSDMLLYSFDACSKPQHLLSENNKAPTEIQQSEEDKIIDRYVAVEYPHYSVAERNKVYYALKAFFSAFLDFEEYGSYICPTGSYHKILETLHDVVKDVNMLVVEPASMSSQFKAIMQNLFLEKMVNQSFVFTPEEEARLPKNYPSLTVNPLIHAEDNELPAGLLGKDFKDCFHGEFKQFEKFNRYKTMEDTYKFLSKESYSDYDYSEAYKLMVHALNCKEKPRITLKAELAELMVSSQKDYELIDRVISHAENRWFYSSSQDERSFGGP